MTMENPEDTKTIQQPVHPPDHVQQCADRRDHLSADLPEEGVQSTRTRILAAVRKKQQASASRRTLRDLLDIPGWTWGMGAAVLVVLAFVAITTVSDNQARKSKPMVAEAPVVERTAVPPPAVPKPEVKPFPAPRPEEPVSTLAELQAEFQRLKASDKGVTRAFVDKIHEHIVKLAETPDQQIAAQQLMVSAYEEMGEKDEALVAFEKYLDLVEKRDGKEKAALVARRKGESLFYEKQEFLYAMAYFDVVATRYPDSPHYGHARYMTAKYYEKTRSMDKAAEEYQRIITEMPDSQWARAARQDLPLVLNNIGKPKAALTVLDQMEAKSTNEEDAGYALFHRGITYYMSGEPGYPQALKAFRTLTEKFPGHRYAQGANDMIAVIRSKYTREILGQ
jgi:tetratricopeptide (TPR) repeat protein